LLQSIRSLTVVVIVSIPFIYCLKVHLHHCFYSWSFR